MYMALSPGALGLKVNGLEDAIALARDNGYGGVEIGIHEVAALVKEHGAAHVVGMFANASLKPAGFGLPMQWNGPEDAWREGLKQLDELAACAASIGCTRTMTWLMPGSNDVPTDDNRRFHIERFGPIAEVLARHGCRLGLEFIGPKTIRDRLRYPFVYRMLDMVELGRDIGPNVGLLLDCWHWYTSGGTLDELGRLSNEQIVYVHVNDAPRGVPLDEHVDNKRCLPGATGVIDIVGFLQTLQRTGYDGPVVAEPFGSPASWAADALRGCFEKAGVRVG
ncbi:MAG: sugar phosphate isomerase/epimerase [Chthonomonadales bacterium]|nr:sugar phosphate isomerase/epimerase [Chthonomonadales bacterium]